MKISILLPSRGRPAEFERMYNSVMETVDDQSGVEFVLYLDHDDPKAGLYGRWPNVKHILGDRILLSEMWNVCYRNVENPELVMHAGDDLIFKTKGWDTIVRGAFDTSEDKILFVHGDDLHWDTRFGTHGILHKNWIDVVGYFVPPYFSSDFNDTWLNDVANGLGRRIYLPFVTEHMHPLFGKAEYDQTHKDRLERHQRDNVGPLYSSKQSERERDIAKLREFINSFRKTI